jgi:hypothetical protein
MIYSPPGPIVHLAMACSPENMVNETHTHTHTHKHNWGVQKRYNIWRQIKDPILNVV